MRSDAFGRSPADKGSAWRRRRRRSIFAGRPDGSAGRLRHGAGRVQGGDESRAEPSSPGGSGSVQFDVAIVDPQAGQGGQAMLDQHDLGRGRPSVVRRCVPVTMAAVAGTWTPQRQDRCGRRRSRCRAGPAGIGVHGDPVRKPMPRELRPGGPGCAGGSRANACSRWESRGRLTGRPVRTGASPARAWRSARMGHCGGGGGCGVGRLRRGAAGAAPGVVAAGKLALSVVITASVMSMCGL